MGTIFSLQLVSSVFQSGERKETLLVMRIQPNCRGPPLQTAVFLDVSNSAPNRKETRAFSFFFFKFFIYLFFLSLFDELCRTGPVPHTWPPQPAARLHTTRARTLWRHAAEGRAVGAPLGERSTTSSRRTDAASCSTSVTRDANTSPRAAPPRTTPRWRPCAPFTSAGHSANPPRPPGRCRPQTWGSPRPTRAPRWCEQSDDTRPRSRPVWSTWRRPGARERSRGARAVPRGGTLRRMLRKDTAGGRRGVGRRVSGRRTWGPSSHLGRGTPGWQRSPGRATASRREEMTAGAMSAATTSSNGASPVQVSPDGLGQSLSGPFKQRKPLRSFSSLIFVIMSLFDLFLDF